MPLNIELAEKVLEQITKHPETHDQQNYRYVNCKTTMCIAGWAAQLAGGKWVPPAAYDNTTSSLHVEPDDPEDHRRQIFVGEDFPGADKDGYLMSVGAHARGQRVLGLTDDRADAMFEAIPEGEAIAMLRRSIRSAKAARTRRGDA